MICDHCGLDLPEGKHYSIIIEELVENHDGIAIVYPIDETRTMHVRCAIEFLVGKDNAKSNL